jgi:hypothetical protein
MDVEVTVVLRGVREAGILPSFAGIVVSGRYAGYYSQTRANFAGRQACAGHLTRDSADCAETCPGAAWPEQAIRSLRGLVRGWHAAREQGLPAIPAQDREPLETEFRRAVTVGLAAVSRVPGPRNQVKQRPAASSSSSARPGRPTCSGPPPVPASGRRTTSQSAAAARKHGLNAHDVLYQLMTGNTWLPPAQPISP